MEITHQATKYHQDSEFLKSFMWYQERTEGSFSPENYYDWLVTPQKVDFLDELVMTDYYEKWLLANKAMDSTSWREGKIEELDNQDNGGGITEAEVIAIIKAQQLKDNLTIRN